MENKWELKDCPFCGSPAYMHGNDKQGFWVKCLLCGMIEGHPFEDEQAAAEFWNIRGRQDYIHAIRGGTRRRSNED